MDRRTGTFYSRVVVAVWLVAHAWLLFASAVPAMRGTNELVYCPLQRAWVERETKPQPKFDLSQICSPGELKNKFILSAQNSLKVVDLEAAYFDFGARGDQAFEALPNERDLPLGEISVQDQSTILGRSDLKHDTAAISSQQKFVGIEAAVITDTSKPPASEPALLAARCLANSSPRAPPVISL